MGIIMCLSTSQKISKRPLRQRIKGEQACVVFESGRMSTTRAYSSEMRPGSNHCRVGIKHHQQQQAKDKGWERGANNAEHARGLIDDSIVMDCRLHSHPDPYQDDRGDRPDGQVQRIGETILDQFCDRLGGGARITKIAEENAASALAGACYPQCRSASASIAHTLAYRSHIVLIMPSMALSFLGISRTYSAVRSTGDMNCSMPKINTVTPNKQNRHQQQTTNNISNHGNTSIFPVFRSALKCSELASLPIEKLIVLWESAHQADSHNKFV